MLQHLPGGSLKCPVSADSESLQASWWDTVTPLPLRCRDILPLIRLALGYRRCPPHPPILPHLSPSPYLALRLALLCLGPGREVWLLQSSSDPPRLPITLCTPRGSILTPLQSLLGFPPPPCGIMGVQHQGGEGADGVCFNIMGGLQAPEPPAVTTGELSWGLVQDGELRGRLEQTLKDNTLLPLYS
ncbi:hypothetical protein FKM82_030734 [Ascaphus truei]